MDNIKLEVILEVESNEIRNKDFFFLEMICNIYCVLFYNFFYVKILYVNFYLVGELYL